ncbi:outer membrane protein assembly factor BamA [Verticiella sediminum]|uniref:Outer membrane protein assembly factor BamA n=1 Tax=Verticiella sediminum TaxID=1247510 RepID=A0A556ABR9_9BURK|nr:outer membrane protein assembly factor BamA [Verticiella sediminum]TSH90328.1 outer membrane protein assembly factor BamA [Verticiella sediminum]
MNLHGIVRSPSHLLRHASRIALVAGALTLAAPAAQAFEPFVVRDIRVEGLQRIEPGTVFGYMPVKVGNQFTEEQATEAVRALFATGFFSDVRIEVRDGVVVAVVTERPTIASIGFNGMREFDNKTVLQSLNQVGFADGRIFDRAVLERAEQELRNQYLARGKYAVEITSTVTPLPRNRVGVAFEVFEGDVAKIRDIRIVGNEAFSDRTLRGLFQLSTPGWLTWYTKTDQYSRQKLQADIDTLRAYYLDRGYLEFNVEPPQVSISPDRRDIHITVTINEGPIYKVGKVQLAGDLLGLDNEFRDLITVKEGETFSAADVNASGQAISDYLGDLGYAFANVNPNPAIDRETKVADLTYFVDPNRRVYVRRINIGGNTRTRDTVVRREMRQNEAAWYNAADIQLSRNRIDRLGYFQSVDVESQPVPGTPDQVDVNVNVQERPTGMINLGVGYSSADRVMLMAGISEDNVFGTGTNLGFQVNTSSRNRAFVLSHTDPYFTRDGISRTTSLYYRRQQQWYGNTGDYELRTGGLGMNFGIPFSEIDRVNFGGTYERNEITIYDDSPFNYREYVEQYGPKSDAFILSTGWTRDTRDSALAPREGYLTRLSGEGSVLGDLRYYSATAQGQVYWPVSRDITLALNAQVDYGRGYSGQPYPPLKNFYAGGIGSVRGYESGSLGPRDPDTNDFIGGAKRVFFNTQLYLPFPGAQQDRTLRWFAFVDGGQVYANNQNINLGDLRYSAGIGLSWDSPLGPLQISWGRALNKKDGDDTEPFQFQIGTTF